MQYLATITDALIVFCGLLMTLAPVLLLLFVFLLPFCPDIECDGYWKRFPFLLLQVLAVPAGFFVVTMLVVIYEFRGYFAEHFEEYRCKPWFLPFVSLVQSDVSVSENFQHCYGNICRVVQGSLMNPMMDLATHLNSGQNIQADNLSKIQSQMVQKKEANAVLYHSMNNQMGAFQAVGKGVLKRVGAIFTGFFTTILDMYYNLISLVNTFEMVVYLPQIVLRVILLIGAYLIMSGFYDMLLGIASLKNGTIIDAVGVLWSGEPLTAVEGAEMVTIGESIEIPRGNIMIGLAITMLAIGAFYSSVGELFSVMLFLANTENDRLQQAQHLQQAVLG